MPDDESAPAVDRDALRPIYDGFLAANQPFKAACFEWQDLDEVGRWDKAAELTGLVDTVEPSLRRTAELLPHFSGYLERLMAARAKVEAGQHDYAVGVRVDSLHMVWMEIHQDYLSTLGISREAEGSY